MRHPSGVNMQPNTLLWGRERLRASCTCAYRQVWRGPGWAGYPACDRLYDAAWWKAAAAAWEWGQLQGGLSSGTWCVWSPQSTSVLPRTAGQCSRQRRQRGRTVTWEHSGTVPSSAPPLAPPSRVVRGRSCKLCFGEWKVPSTIL